MLWDIRFRTYKQLLADQPDVLLVDRRQKRAAVTNVAVPAHSTIRKKGHKMIEN